MRDLTKDSVAIHIMTLAAPVAMTLVSQIAYQLVDLYFVTRISVAATAGVNAAGNIVFVIGGLAQILVVGTAALVAHAIGRKDLSSANQILNQSLFLSGLCSVALLLVLVVCVHSYMLAVASDNEIVRAGTQFILCALPGYAMMLPMAVLSAALRGSGVVRPVMAIYVFTVLSNAALAPILIAGWGTGMALGIRGAGLATSLSVLIGLTLLGTRFHRLQSDLAIKAHLMRPDVKRWLRVLNIGLPAGGELALMFLYAAVVYHAIRAFGASAQAGFGIGSRMLQTILLPGMAIAFAAGPIAGQNFSAGHGERVRETFRQATLIGTVLMIAITLLVQWQPHALVRLFAADPHAIAVAVFFLRIMSWSFVAQGMVYICAAMFQGFGNTVPLLIGAATRFLSFSIPVESLSTHVDFRIEHVWYLSIVSVILQAIVSLYFLRREFRKRLTPIG
jgi:putative MATE family efflux protein